jgi:ribosomal protein S18 acetylase RimI-like enzyme
VAGIEAPSPRRYSLPGGSGGEIVVSGISTADARDVLGVMAAAWHDTYVKPGWLSVEKRVSVANPRDNDHVLDQADRIREAKNALEAGDKYGQLFLGAFAVGELVGFVRVGSYMATTLAGRVWHEFTDESLGRSIGYIFEIDVLPSFQRRGIGRALAAVALEHNRNIGHTEVRLHVYEPNTSAKAFYATQLTMAPHVGTTLEQGMRECPKMRRRLMSAETDKAQSVLLAGNKWLNPRA